MTTDNFQVHLPAGYLQAGLNRLQSEVKRYQNAGRPCFLPVLPKSCHNVTYTSIRSVERFELCFIYPKPKENQLFQTALYICVIRRGDGGIDKGVVGY